jgi:hypothetical protein
MLIFIILTLFYQMIEILLVYLFKNNHLSSQYTSISAKLIVLLIMLCLISKFKWFSEELFVGFKCFLSHRCREVIVISQIIIVNSYLIIIILLGNLLTIYLH